MKPLFSRMLGTLAAGLSLGLGAAAAHADGRAALVIGNSKYQNVEALDNPDKDAKGVYDALRKIGFTDVTLALDYSRADLITAMRAFRQRATGADIALIYYAGHGMEDNGHNYLIPVDAKLKNEDDLDDEAISEELAQAATAGASKLSVVILDACRNNPFADSMVMNKGGQRSRGLIPIKAENLAGDYMVEYAAAAGKKASDGDPGTDHSPFAKALITHIGDPGVDVLRIFGAVNKDVQGATHGAQTPVQVITVSGDTVYFVPPPGGGAYRSAPIVAAAPPLPPPPPDPKTIELTFWQSVVKSDDPDQLSVYLTRYPNGDFAALAKQKIVSLERQQALRAPQSTATTGTGAGASDALLKGDAAFHANDFIGALRWYQIAAGQGNTAAQNNIGDLYDRGQGVPKDYVQAMHWYRLAADQGDASGQFSVGVLYGRGQGVPADPVEAARWYQKSADQGYAKAQHRLGWAYANGQGVSRDLTQALRWNRLSADQGYALAQDAVGYDYLNGRGVTADYGEAMRWYMKAAGQNDPVAQSQIGYIYRNAKGVTQNYAEAMRWYQLAAAQGNAFAISTIGYMYLHGEGVAKDPAQALVWYHQAAAQGDASAESQIGYMLQNGVGVAQDYVAAMSWYQMAAKAGNAVAISQIGYLYNYGLGVPQDFAKALQWYRVAADRGNPVAQLCVGNLYARGQGVQQDFAQAASWYRKAADQGNANAQSALGALFDQGKGVARDPDQARAWMTKAATAGDARGKAWLALNQAAG